MSEIVDGLEELSLSELAALKDDIEIEIAGRIRAGLGERKGLNVPAWKIKHAARHMTLKGEDDGTQ